MNERNDMEFKLGLNSNLGSDFSWTLTPYMELEGSLPCSQKSITGPYHQPGESNLHPVFLDPF
jgi:hypothetical protein